MWIKSLIAGVDRIIHGGKHYPVIDSVADVPKEVRDELVVHTHFEDATHEIDPKTIKAVQEANKAAEAPKDLPEVNTPEEPEKEPEKLPEVAEDVPEVSEAPKEEEAPKSKTKLTKTK